MSTTVAEQMTFAEMVGRLAWEDVEIPTHDLPTPLGVEPDRSFVSTVREAGVMVPVLLAELRPGVYEVIDGNRRVRAAIEAGLPSIPARVLRGSDASLAILTIVANEQRSSNPIVEYWAIKAMMTGSVGMSESVIASLTGMSVQTIRKRMQLEDLSPEFMGVLELGEIAPSMAERIAKLDAIDQAAVWERWVEKAGKVTTVDIREVREASRPTVGTLGLPSMPLPSPAWEAKGFGGIIESIDDAIEYVNENAATIDAVEVTQFLDAIRSCVVAVAARKEGWG